MDRRAQSLRPARSDMCIRLGCDGDRNQVGKLVNSRWREKLLSCFRRPYRKPTQVDEEKILRRTG